MLDSLLQKYDLTLNKDQCFLLEKYYEILRKKNETVNLVSRKLINDENTFLEMHLVDSILFLNDFEELLSGNSNPNIFDIGSGGGLPGIPLAITKPRWSFTLCDSIKKKCVILEEIVSELELKNVKVLNRRVEEIHNKKEFKNNFDLVTSKAVTNLKKLILYSLPLLKNSGVLAAYKSANIDDEFKEATQIIENKDLFVDIKTKPLGETERKMVFISKPSL